MPRTDRTQAKATAKQMKFSREHLQGTILNNPRLVHFDVTVTAPTWVVSVDVGGNRHLTDVPIKGGGNGENFYAQRGTTVLLRRNSAGRYEIIGPGDKLAGIANVKSYDLGITAPTVETTVGFNSVPVEFDFYETLDVGALLGSFWNDGQNEFNLVQIIDENGTVVG